MDLFLAKSRFFLEQSYRSCHGDNRRAGGQDGAIGRAVFRLPDHSKVPNDRCNWKVDRRAADEQSTARPWPHAAHPIELQDSDRIAQAIFSDAVLFAELLPRSKYGADRPMPLAEILFNLSCEQSGAPSAPGDRRGCSGCKLSRHG